MPGDAWDDGGNKGAAADGDKKVEEPVSPGWQALQSRFSPVKKEQKLLDIRIGNHFRMLEKLGAGSFGDIYRGVNLNTGDEVAIKLEPASTKHPQLIDEARLCKQLSADGPRGVPPNADKRGIPVVHWYGHEGDYHVMIVDLLGPSLEDLFSYCGRAFTLKTVCAIGKQMVSRLEFLHSKHMLHRDVKPDNFLTGVGKRASIVYLIDFGLAKPYRDPMTLQHIPYRVGKGLSGTARYASRATHMGIEQSRRDDLEAVAYMLVYFLKGGLPWQGMQMPAKKPSEDDLPPGTPKAMGKVRAERQKNELDKTARIGQRKLAITPAQLCSGCPAEITALLEYCMNLRFEDKPDYAHIRSLLAKIEQREGYPPTCPMYDWVIKGRAVVAERQQSMSHSGRRRSGYRVKASASRPDMYQAPADAGDGPPVLNLN